MKVFVTGGNGFIGSRVFHRLVEAGHSVRCLLRATSDTRRIQDLSYERVTGDIRDAKSLTAGMQGSDACIHLASVSSWYQIRSEALRPTVLDGTRNVLQAAVDAGKVRTVYVSSSTAVNASAEPTVFNEETPFQLKDTPLTYAILKHEAEQLVQSFVREQSLPVVIVNPAEVYGPNDIGFVTAGNIRDILKNWPALACRGGTAVTHVDDAAAGIVAAMVKGRVGERYILGGENLSVEKLVRLTLDVAGQKKPVLRLPNGPLRWGVQTLAKLGVPTPVIPEVLDYATRFFYMDSSKAMSELGYNPRPAREVLGSVVQWLSDAGHVSAKMAQAGLSAPSGQ